MALSGYTFCSDPHPQGLSLPTYTMDMLSPSLELRSKQTLEVIHGGAPAWLWRAFAISMWCQGHTIPAALEAVVGTPFAIGQDMPLFPGNAGLHPQTFLPS